MIDTRPSIVIEYRNRQPVELLQLTASLSAIGQQFERSTSQAAGAVKPALYVRDLRTGSVIAELVSLLEGFETILKHREVLGAFMSHWQETLTSILHLTPQAKKVEKQELRAVRSFVDVTANDEGSQLNMFVQEGGTVNQNFYLSSDDARRVHQNANHLLGSLPNEERFTNEPMVLFQVRDGPPSKAGDRGYIDRFSPTPKKLTFGSEAAKEAILGRAENPFDMVFFVSGVAKTAGGAVAAYHILSLDSVEPKEGE